MTFFTNKWSYLLIYITFSSEYYIPKFTIMWFIFTKKIKKINYKLESQ